MKKRVEGEVEFPSVLKVSLGEGRHRADAIGIVTKEGVIATVFGGERSHFGAVAFAYPTKALHSENIWLNLNLVSVPEKCFLFLPVSPTRLASTGFLAYEVPQSST